MATVRYFITSLYDGTIHRHTPLKEAVKEWEDMWGQKDSDMPNYEFSSVKSDDMLIDVITTEEVMYHRITTP